MSTSECTECHTAAAATTLTATCDSSICTCWAKYVCVCLSCVRVCDCVVSTVLSLVYLPDNSLFCTSVCLYRRSTWCTLTRRGVRAVPPTAVRNGPCSVTVRVVCCCCYIRVASCCYLCCVACVSDLSVLVSVDDDLMSFVVFVCLFLRYEEADVVLGVGFVVRCISFGVQHTHQRRNIRFGYRCVCVCSLLCVHVHVCMRVCSSVPFSVYMYTCLTL